MGLKEVLMQPYFQNEHGQLYNCDVLDGLKSLPDNSVDLIVTSPPYWGLRDYGVDGQIGLETDFQTFLGRLVEIFTECHRVLKPSGNLYVNMGDSYSGSSKGQTSQGNADPKRATKGMKLPKCKFFLPAKSLIGQPWRLAFALQDSGWILREDIIWAKGNPMPESVTDRCTRAHEYIFHFTKLPKYYYDAFSIREAYADKTFTTWGNQKSTSADGSGLVKAENFAGMVHAPKVWKTPDGWAKDGSHDAISHSKRERKDKPRGAKQPHEGFNTKWDLMSVKEQRAMGANKRSVWAINQTALEKQGLFKSFLEELHAIRQAKAVNKNGRRSVWKVGTKPFRGAHFATFPPDLIAPIIQAACPLGGTVLDIFGGSGTSAFVAEQFQRKWLLFELNPKYCDIAVKRIQGVTIEDSTPMLGGEKLVTIEDFIEVQS